MSRSYPALPMVGVGVVVLKGDDTLMVRRGNEPGYGRWSIPGGCQELGETVFEAAVREVAEETGIAIRPLGLIDVVDSIRPDPTGRVQYHYTLIEVLATPVSGTLAAAADAMDAAWVHRKDLVSLDLWSETVRIIEAGRVLLEQGQLATR